MDEATGRVKLALVPRHLVDKIDYAALMGAAQTADDSDDDDTESMENMITDAQEQEYAPDMTLE